ncbi:hypothetical protein MMC09_006868 [Bachmanniomyces sp. S44760]|nr:hypothetical protein [Bachmanniomyces sp. S44760]
MACSSAVLNGSRRATTAVAKRRARFGDIFTVFYSSILATAAVADARRKDNRKGRLEQEMKVEKEKLQAMQQDYQKRLNILATPIESLEQYGNEYDILRSIRAWAVEQNEVGTAIGLEDQGSIAAQFADHLTERQLRRLLSRRRILCLLILPDTSETDPGVKCDAQILTSEWSTAKMVLNFLWSLCGPLQKSFSQTSTIERIYWESIQLDQDELRRKRSRLKLDLRKLRRMRGGENCYILRDRLSPSLPRHERTDFTVQNQRRLHVSLQAILSPMVSVGMTLDTIVAKVCYELLLCPAAPDIRVYNTLISRLSQLRRFEMVDAVLASMKERNIQPDASTMAATLRSFGMRKEAGAFMRYARVGDFDISCNSVGEPRITKILRTLRSKIRDVDQDQDTHQLSESEELGMVSDWSQSSENRVHTRSDHSLAQNITNEVLVIGLKFFGNDKVSQWIDELCERGWSPDMNILTGFLKHSYHTQDWNLAKSAWRGLVDLSGETYKIAYFWMLRLCQMFGKHELFRATLLHGIDQKMLPANALQISFDAGPQDLERGLQSTGQPKDSRLDRSNNKRLSERHRSINQLFTTDNPLARPLVAALSWEVNLDSAENLKHVELEKYDYVHESLATPWLPTDSESREDHIRRLIDTVGANDTKRLRARSGSIEKDEPKYVRIQASEDIAPPALEESAVEDSENLAAVPRKAKPAIIADLKREQTVDEPSTEALHKIKAIIAKPQFHGIASAKVDSALEQAQSSLTREILGGGHLNHPDLNISDIGSFKSFATSLSRGSAPKNVRLASSGSTLVVEQDSHAKKSNANVTDLEARMDSSKPGRNHFNHLDLTVNDVGSFRSFTALLPRGTRPNNQRSIKDQRLPKLTPGVIEMPPPAFMVPYQHLQNVDQPASSSS